MKIGINIYGSLEFSTEKKQKQTIKNDDIANANRLQTPANLIENGKSQESMYDRLKRICNPANYVDNYDKNKVDAANRLYSKLLQINSYDINSVIELVISAEKDLNTNFLDEYQFNSLKKILNPKNFMEPYDAQRVSLSNELYSQLLQPDMNYTKYMQIVSNAAPLLKTVEEREMELEEKRIEKERRENEVQYWYFEQ